MSIIMIILFSDHHITLIKFQMAINLVHLISIIPQPTLSSQFTLDLIHSLKRESMFISVLRSWKPFFIFIFFKCGVWTGSLGGQKIFSCPKPVKRRSLKNKGRGQKKSGFLFKSDSTEVKKSEKCLDQRKRLQSLWHIYIVLY